MTFLQNISQSKSSDITQNLSLLYTYTLFLISIQIVKTKQSLQSYLGEGHNIRHGRIVKFKLLRLCLDEFGQLEYSL